MSVWDLGSVIELVLIDLPPGSLRNVFLHCDESLRTGRSNNAMFSKFVLTACMVVTGYVTGVCALVDMLLLNSLFQ